MNRDSPVSPTVSQTEYYCTAGNARRVMSALRAGPCEVYVIGASVATQKDGWPAYWIECLQHETGHSHILSKCVMGGVGILFALPYLDDVPRPCNKRVAIVEFSTGDLNFGHVPIDQLSAWIRELLKRLIASGALPLVMHCWRADHETQDKHGIRAAYDRVASELGVSVISSHRWVSEQAARGKVRTAEWFRDVCHTTPAGAEAYASYLLACLNAAPADVIGDATQQRTTCTGRVNLLPVAHFPGARDLGAAKTFVYPLTGQAFDVCVLESDQAVHVRLSGELLGVAMLAGPRAGWISIEIDGKPFRKLRAFDRHSHYERYLLQVCFAELRDVKLTARCSDQIMDTSIATKEHPDFLLPRQFAIIGFIGRDLRLA